MLALLIDGQDDEEARRNAVRAPHESTRVFDPKSSVSLTREDGSEIEKSTIEGLSAKRDEFPDAV